MAQTVLTGATAELDEWDINRDYHNSLLHREGTEADRANNLRVQESKNTPLFSVDVARSLTTRIGENPFPQYGLLGEKVETFQTKDRRDEEGSEEPDDRTDGSEDRRIFVNMNAPFSAFLCGSQGSGKSHTLSCMLEGALKESRAGKLQQPLAGLVFHYDNSSRSANHQPCEAAYLCSMGIPVRVLVPVSSAYRMEEAYANLPGLPADAPKPVVCPLLLREEHLDVKSMMKLMKVDPENGVTPLYIEVVCNLLRELSVKDDEPAIVDYGAFLKELQAQKLTVGQNGPLKMRLTLLEAVMVKFASSFLGKWEKKHPAQKRIDIWSFEPGTLTIVDLSDPWINEGQACALFDICLHLFKDLGPKAGKIVALDEAHKFMTSTDQSSVFTESLLHYIREQRHSGIRVIIATQEPTISPKLLDLCSMTVVHRFTSPAWFQTLKAHLAGVATLSDGDSSREINELFDTIVHLAAGQALLFSPLAMLEAADTGPLTSSHSLKLQKLGRGYVKMQVRERLTADGGKSVMAV